MLGIGDQLLHSLDHTLSTPTYVVMTELFDEFHNRVVDVGNIGHVKDNGFADGDVSKITLEADKIGKDR